MHKNDICFIVDEIQTGLFDIQELYKIIIENEDLSLLSEIYEDSKKILNKLLLVKNRRWVLSNMPESWYFQSFKISNLNKFE